MSLEPNLTQTDYELLSAYIDGMLGDSARTLLEQRLQAEPALQTEFVALRQTVALINRLPVLKAPRNFTLTPAMVGQKAPQIQMLPPAKRRPFVIPLTAMTGVASAAASLVFIVLGVLLLFSGTEEQESSSVALRAATAAPEVGLFLNTAPSEAMPVLATPATMPSPMVLEAVLPEEEAPMMAIQQQEPGQGGASGPTFAPMSPPGMEPGMAPGIGGGYDGEAAGPMPPAEMAPGIGGGYDMDAASGVLEEGMQDMAAEQPQPYAVSPDVLPTGEIAMATAGEDRNEAEEQAAEASLDEIRPDTSLEDDNPATGALVEPANEPTQQRQSTDDNGIDRTMLGIAFIGIGLWLMAALGAILGWMKLKRRETV